MRKLILISVFAVAAALAGTAIAAEPLSSPAPGITPLPNIDWRELFQDMGEGDHVVGEEMCARPR